MPRIAPLPWHVLACVFESFGFVKDRQTSSHIVYGRPGTMRPLIIPKYEAVGRDIILGLIRTAKISREEFFAALDKCK